MLLVGSYVKIPFKLWEGLWKDNQSVFMFSLYDSFIYWRRIKECETIDDIKIFTGEFVFVEFLER